MLQTHSPESSLTMIERPRCPKCQIRMMLVGIEPSFAGPDLRTFECPKWSCARRSRLFLAEDLRESQWPPKMIKLGMSGVPRTKSSEKHERLSEN